MDDPETSRDALVAVAVTVARHGSDETQGNSSFGVGDTVPWSGDRGCLVVMDGHGCFLWGCDGRFGRESPDFMRAVFSLVMSRLPQECRLGFLVYAAFSAHDFL